MDKPTYHATLKKMHDAGVDSGYSHGWASGALENTPLEEQRVTEAYTAGYEDGKSGDLEKYKNWISAKD